MEDEGRGIYRSLQKRRVMVIAALVAVTTLLFLLSMSLGAMGYGFMDAVRTLVDPGSADETMRITIIDSRLHVATLALLVGLALGMAGAEMQTVLDNPLADPYTLGMSSAAAFGASLVIAYGLGVGLLGMYATPVAAFIVCLVTCAALYAVAKIKTATRSTIILMGVALLFLFQSLVSLVQATSSQDSAVQIMFWMFGRLKDTTPMEEIVLILVAIVGAAALFMTNAWKLTALKLGDSKARSLGVDVEKLRRNVIVGVSMLTAAAVSFTGTIGFIGLVGPHIARILVGEDQRFFLPVSALCGGALLCAASCLIKLNSFTESLPIGVITSLIGVPFFVFLILKGRRSLS
ncbi:iron ABC transporter permease [Methanomassiliicoccaceae archaeon COG_1]|nr:iron ABC transporter permease [Methanomassiliicoccaceae archaeon COG_1]